MEDLNFLGMNFTENDNNNNNDNNCKYNVENADELYKNIKGALFNKKKGRKRISKKDKMQLDNITISLLTLISEYQ